MRYTMRQLFWLIFLVALSLGSGHCGYRWGRQDAAEDCRAAIETAYQDGAKAQAAHIERMSAMYAPPRPPGPPMIEVGRISGLILMTQDQPTAKTPAPPPPGSEDDPRYQAEVIDGALIPAPAFRKRDPVEAPGDERDHPLLNLLNFRDEAREAIPFQPNGLFR